jgi:hypothetical protein
MAGVQNADVFSTNFEFWFRISVGAKQFDSEITLPPSFIEPV